MIELNTQKKQYSASELFQMWYNGNYTIAELANRYGHNETALSRQFSRMMYQKKNINKI